ncbi:MAG TPA: amidohydrolase family protein [Burkholderiales bacterium]|nr:amidohydrolase family protein [Burkholderiales bacterium]
MLIADAQVHIWESGTPVNIHRQVSHYTKDELLRDMNAAGVDRVLLHPPSWDVRANEVAIEAARLHPDRLAILGFFDVSKPENRSLIETWKQQPGMLGLRFAFLKPGEENWMVDGTLDWLWPAAERAGLPIGLLVPNRCKVAGDIAEKHPGLKLMIDHMARPRGSKDDAGFADLDELLALAKYPNVSVKATGAPAYSSEAYPYRNIHKHLHRIFDAFGPQRMFWGTDITRMPCTWRQCVTMFTEELPWLKGNDLELVMGRALCEWVGWKDETREE